MHDLVIINGSIIDGSGAPAFDGDVAIKDGKIVAVGKNLGEAKETLDAKGCIVTPGFVDIHTHYDAQVTWDPYVTPSTWHGVTTCVMGNCGVGFAPVRADRQKWLIQTMEGVEDIPGAAMTEGMNWDWETFPEYLDAIGKFERCIDIATQVPHVAIRGYVMGDRGIKNEPATPEDIEAMAALVKEGIEAGALGFSTSRTLIHKDSLGNLVAGTFAEEDELFGIARAMGDGVFQMTSNHVDMADEFEWMRRLSRETGRTVSFNLLQPDEAPDLYKKLLGLLDEAADEGLSMFGQVAGRPSGLLMTWAGTAHPFLATPTYMTLHHLPFEERLVELKKSDYRSKIIAESSIPVGGFEDFILNTYTKMFRLGTEPDYEPTPEDSAAAIAEARGVSPREVIYEWLMEDDGKGIIYFPIFNYANTNMDHMADMLKHPHTRMGLGDGGAHCGVVCDASIETFMLTHWARDRTRGERLPLELMIRRQSHDTATAYGLHDRGLLSPGYQADVNIIDFDALKLHAPYIAYDLPTDARRFVQKADGYRFTIARGQVIMVDGEPTGALPGQLLRGTKAAPAQA